MLKYDTPLAYLLALAAVAAAVALRRMLDPWLGGGYPFITLFVAVGFAAAWGGRGPALAAILASIAAVILMHEPAASPKISKP